MIPKGTTKTVSIIHNVDSIFSPATFQIVCGEECVRAIDGNAYSVDVTLDFDAAGRVMTIVNSASGDSCAKLYTDINSVPNQIGNTLYGSVDSCEEVNSGDCALAYPNLAFDGAQPLILCNTCANYTCQFGSQLTVPF